MKYLILLTACIIPIGCSASLSASQSTATYSDLQISMERGVCFGTCPIYKLTIHADGTINYEGIKFVKIEGNRTAQISPEHIEELVTAIQNIKFFSLENEYAPNFTDMPSIKLSITLNGRSKTIWHYGLLACGAEKATEDLCQFERQIDEVVNSNQWVKQDN